jgi:hypothetical protein
LNLSVQRPYSLGVHKQKHLTFNLLVSYNFNSKFETFKAQIFRCPVRGQMGIKVKNQR